MHKRPTPSWSVYVHKHWITTHEYKSTNGPHLHQLVNLVPGRRGRQRKEQTAGLVGRALQRQPVCQRRLRGALHHRGRAQVHHLARIPRVRAHLRDTMALPLQS